MRSSHFLILYDSCKGRGFGNLMFPLWDTLLAGSLVFLDMGPSILLLVFPLFCGCFGLFMIGRVSSFFGLNMTTKGPHSKR